MANPTVATSLSWAGGLRFTASSTSGAVTLDGDGTAGPTPVEALAFSLAGCMGVDVVDILVKGRYSLEALDANLVAERAEEPPRRLLRVTLQFILRGNAPTAAIERAIALSRDKYCSVWHSLRPDIELLTSHEVRP
jgi:putative redox protein